MFGSLISYLLLITHQINHHVQDRLLGDIHMDIVIMPSFCGFLMSRISAIVLCFPQQQHELGNWITF